MIIGLSVTVQLRADRGIKMNDITISANGRQLAGLIARPEGNHAAHSLPAVAVFHGFTASKEMMRPFIEGLARVGFVVIAIDQQGHGHSTGNLREDGENSLRNDGVAVVAYLRGLSSVDPAKVAILGHSMGAGTAIATSTYLGDLAATVLIGNSLDGGQEYNLTPSFPSNVLLAVGKYDELFTIDDAITTLAKLITTSPQVNTLYGNFDDGTARELLVTPTDHILEVLNARIVERSIEWIYKSLVDATTNLTDPALQSVKGWQFILDQLLSAIAALGMILLIPLSFAFLPRKFNREDREISWISQGFLAFIAFILAIPTAFLGTGSFAVLFISWFILGSLFYTIKRMMQQSRGFGEVVRDEFEIRPDAGIAIVLLAGLMLMVHAILLVVPWDYRYVIPILSGLSLRRLGLFLIMFLPGSIYFTIEVAALGGKSALSMKQFGREVAARIWAFMLLLAVYYLPIIIFQTPLLPSLVGFLAFFIVGLIPVMVILTLFSSFGRRYHWSNLAIGILSAGLVCWMLASTLSFNA